MEDEPEAVALPPLDNLTKSFYFYFFASFCKLSHFKTASLYVAQVCLSYVDPVADNANREEKFCMLTRGRSGTRHVRSRENHPRKLTALHVIASQASQLLAASTVVKVRPHPDLSSTHKRKQTHTGAVPRDRIRALAPHISRPRRSARSPPKELPHLRFFLQFYAFILFILFATVRRIFFFV